MRVNESYAGETTQGRRGGERGDTRMVRIAYRGGEEDVD